MLGLFIGVLLTPTVLCSNILFITGIPSPSHHIFNRVLAFALAEKGHNVTMIAPDAEKETHKNFNFILMEGVYESMDEAFDIMTIIGMNKIESVYYMYEWANLLCSANLNSKGLRTLLDYPSDFKFDLIIFDNTVGQCLYPIIDKFQKPPVVIITAFLLPHYLSNLMGNHVFPSYYPHYGLQASNKMAFFDRLYSFALTYGETFYRNYIYSCKQNEFAKEYFGENMRPMLEVEKSFALLLSNTDPILDYPVALPPNIIPIGGMHIKPPKPLPKDLESIMNRTKHGVIYFSLGTNIQSQLLPDEMKNEFLAAFGKLEQTVLWKYNGHLENLPPNVVTRKWLPQSDILGHPNCKLFISHGGGLSTQEAIYHGVPVIGIPGFADQHKNVFKIVNKGLGKKLDFSKISKDTVYEVIMEVLKNPIYSENMKKVSQKYKDQPQTPLERAIFWSEYVIRHGDLKDLELPARDMYFYQTSNLDVILFIFGVTFAAIYILIKIVRFTCGSKSKEKVKIH